MVAVDRLADLTASHGSRKPWEPQAVGAASHGRGTMSKIVSIAIAGIGVGALFVSINPEILSSTGLSGSGVSKAQPAYTVTRAPITIVAGGATSAVLRIIQPSEPSSRPNTQRPQIRSAAVTEPSHQVATQPTRTDSAKIRSKKRTELAVAKPTTPTPPAPIAVRPAAPSPKPISSTPDRVSPPSRSASAPPMSVSGTRVSVASATPASASTTIAFKLQQELRRVGCYQGRIDGDWGPSSRYAMARFTKAVHVVLLTSQPDTELLSLVRRHTDQACDHVKSRTHVAKVPHTNVRTSNSWPATVSPFQNNLPQPGLQSSNVALRTKTEPSPIPRIVRPGDYTPSRPMVLSGPVVVPPATGAPSPTVSAEIAPAGAEIGPTRAKIAPNRATIAPTQTKIAPPRPGRMSLGVTSHQRTRRASPSKRSARVTRLRRKRVARTVVVSPRAKRSARRSRRNKARRSDGARRAYIARRKRYRAWRNQFIKDQTM